MRILVVNQYFPPDVAASAYLLGELTEDLARRHEVVVVAGRPSYNPEAGTFRPQGVRVLHTPSTSFSRAGIPGRLANYLTFTCAALVRACLVARPDVVVTMTDPPVAGVIGAVAAGRHRRSLVQICHDVYPDIAVALGRLRAPAGIRLWRRLNRWVRNRAVRIVVVGRDMREKLAGEGTPPEKLVYIPAWANDQDVREEQVARTREELGWEGRFVVMHAGNMGLAQNLSMFPAVAERLARHPEVVIVFLGDGAVRKELVQDVRRRDLENVLFLDYRPKPEAQVLMSAADLHVVSLVKGLWGCATPSKTYGIMAAGRPFVAAVDPGSEPARIAEELGCGLRVDPGDPDALASAILQLRDAPLDEMGRRGRSGFEQRFRRPLATRALGELLEDVRRAGKPVLSAADRRPR